MSTSQSLNRSGNDDNNTPADAILQAAHRCRQLFRDTTDAYALDENVISRVDHLLKPLTTRRSTLSFDDLIDDFEQFRVWIRNLGVFAPDQTSLDYRLREAQDVKSGIASLLGSLRGDLDALWFLIHDDRKIERHEDDSSSDSTASSSDGSNLQDAAGRSAYELHARLQRVHSTIDKLMQVAGVIRASNPSARAARSATYVHYEDGINVTEQFEKEYLPLVLEHRYKLKASLISRFVMAISLRRRKFLYQTKHQQRLAYSVEDDDHTSGANTMSNPRKILSGYLPPVQTRNMQAAKLQKTLGDSNVLTVATTFKRLQPKKTAPSTIVSASVAAASANLEIPPPPPISERASHFECPYCCVLLPKRKFLVGKGSFSKHLWDKHVLADLQPYVCLEDDCPTPNLHLETRDEWLNHQKWEHMMEWWCEGNSDHEPTKFVTADTYVEHAQQEHRQSPRSATKQASTAGRPSMTPFNACPFCDFDPAVESGPNGSEYKEQPDNFAESLEQQSVLQKHICNELINIFLIALPEREDIKDIDTETGRPPARGSTVRALDHVTISFFDREDREDKDHTTAGFDQTTLDFELSKSPYKIQIEEPEIVSWEGIWNSPQLQECVRSMYTGPENDPHIQEMIAVATKDEAQEAPFEKWIPTLLLETEDNEEPLLFSVGQRVPDDVKGYGIDLALSLSGYADIDFDTPLNAKQQREGASRTQEGATDPATIEDGKTSWAEFFAPEEIRSGNEQKDSASTPVTVYVTPPPQ